MAYGLKIRHTRGAGILAIIPGLLCGPAGHAQDVSDTQLQAVDRQIRQQQSSEAANEAARRARIRQADAAQASGTFAPDPLAPAPGGPCFEIRNIVLSGFEAFARRPEGYRDLIESCATAADIAGALNRINAHYQQQGYVTTRAYVPQQDLADGSLEITIVAGRLEGYVYGDGAKADRRLAAAFPGERGDLLNLRHLEQGLETINAPKSANARFQLIPGEQPGGSFVQVHVEDTRPWHLDLDFNNTGFDSTGLLKATANLRFDNVLNLNDQLSFGLTTTPLGDRQERYSDAWSGSWTLPVDNWTFGIDAGTSDYLFILPGINQSYPVEGQSHYATLSAERLLMRSQKTKLHAYGDLKLTRTRTFIDDNEIETQRRRLTIGSIGLRGEAGFTGGAKLSFDFGAKFGIGAFGAYVLDKSIVDPGFRVVKARLGYDQPIHDTLLYKGTLVAQYSNDILPGTEQFSIGSWSTVRGFHDDSMYGDSGIYLRNTLEWNAYENDDIKLRLIAGLDAGYVKPSALRSWSQDYLAGASVGAEVRIRNRATFTLQVAHALSRPDWNPPNAQPAFEANRTVGYVGLKLDF